MLDKSSQIFWTSSSAVTKMLQHAAVCPDLLLRTKSGIKFYIDTEITFCRWRSIRLSFPSLRIINFFPPIILLQLSSNGRRTNRVAQMAPLGKQAFSRSWSQVMSETEIVGESFRLWSLYIERKINLVASPFLLVLSHIFASNSGSIFYYPLPVLSWTIFLFSDSLTLFRINLHFS